MPLKEKHWNWIKISIYIVAGIFVCGILKLILQIFNGTGPISTGVGKVLGAGANLINGVVNGCSKQPDCSKGSKVDKNSCQNLTNCTFETTKGADGKTTGACISSNGTPPGGGINTMGCALGIGFLAWLAASLLAPIAGFFISLRSKNKTVEDIAAVSGEDVNKVNGEQIRGSSEDSAAGIADFERAGNPVDEVTQRFMSEVTTATRIHTTLTTTIDGNTTRSSMESASYTRMVKSITLSRAEAKADSHGDTSESHLDDAQEAAENIGGIDMMVKSTLHNVSTHNFDLDEMQRSYLHGVITRHGIHLSNEHRALIGMEAGGDTTANSCWTPDTDNTDCTKFKTISLLDEGVTDTLYQWTKDTQEGQCFVCSVDGEPDSTGTFPPKSLKENNDVFPGYWEKGEPDFLVGGVYSASCKKGEYNCLDVGVEQKDGSTTTYEWNKLKHCVSHGNGICTADGAPRCNAGKNLSDMSACGECAAPAIPDTGAPKNSGIYPTNCQLPQDPWYCEYISGKATPGGPLNTKDNKSEGRQFTEGTTMMNQYAAQKLCGYTNNGRGVPPVVPKKGCKPANGFVPEGMDDKVCKVWVNNPTTPYSGGVFGDVFADQECCYWTTGSSCEKGPEGGDWPGYLPSKLISDDSGTTAAIFNPSGMNWTGQYSSKFLNTKTCANSPYPDQHQFDPRP